MNVPEAGYKVVLQMENDEDKQMSFKTTYLTDKVGRQVLHTACRLLLSRINSAGEFSCSRRIF